MGQPFNKDAVAGNESMQVACVCEPGKGGGEAIDGELSAQSLGSLVFLNPTCGITGATAELNCSISFSLFMLQSRRGDNQIC